MKVLFVINNFHSKGNGLSASARRNVKELTKRGIEVKVLSGPNPKEGGRNPEFMLENFNMPIFNPLIKKQGYQFAKTNKRIIKEAVSWADVIHIEEPFNIQIATVKIAKKLHKPCVASYHLHPENLFSSVRLAKFKILNVALLLFWRDFIFNKCKIIHCPTENVKERLIRHHFKSELRVFSNGLVSRDLIQKEKPLKMNYYQIIMIGRLSYEKDPITLLKAMKYSKYKDRIRIVYAGRGPLYKKLRKLADKYYKKGIIKHEVEIAFHNLEELQKIAVGSDIYVHAADVEVEGLSCMEAVQTGLLPIIATSPLSATAQFALSDMNKFKAHNAKDLAAKIDYWLEDNHRRNEEALKYVNIGKEYDIDSSINELINMYKDAIEN